MPHYRLETERLLLRPLELSDASEIHRLAGDFSIADTTLLIPHPYPEGAAEAFILSTQEGAEKGDYTFAVIRKSDAQLIGCMGLGVVARDHRAEIGYWIGKPFWGQGHATDAARRVVQFGFEELNLNRIESAYFMRNPASGRVQQKIGMTFEGVHRQYHWKNGRYEDIGINAILRSEYQT